MCDWVNLEAGGPGDERKKNYCTFSSFLIKRIGPFDAIASSVLPLMCC
jgi:hypothetical protein